MDKRVQHLGRLYAYNLRAANRLPLGKSDAMYSNHYTSVCASPTKENPGKQEKSPDRF